MGLIGRAGLIRYLPDLSFIRGKEPHKGLLVLKAA
jgi:hypothetical protein